MKLIHLFWQPNFDLYREQDQSLYHGEHNAEAEPNDCCDRSLQRHFHAVSRSVVEHNPDNSFILDDVRKRLDQFLASCNAFLLSQQSAELKQKNSLPNYQA